MVLLPLAALAAGRSWPEPPDVAGLVAVAVTPSGDLWLGGRTGMWSRSAGSEAWRTFGEADGLPSAEVTALAADDGGHVWVGTKAGAARVGPSGVDVTMDVDARRPCQVRTVQLSGETAWVSCEGGVGMRWDGAWSFVPVAPRRVVRGPRDAWWGLVYGGVALLGSAGGWAAPFAQGRFEELSVGGGVAWARDGQRVLRIDASGATALALPFRPWSVSARDDGRVWVAGEDGRVWIGDTSGGSVVETPLGEGWFTRRLVRPDGTERWLGVLGAVDVGPGGVTVATDGPVDPRVGPVLVGQELVGIDDAGGIAGLAGPRKVAPPGPSVATRDGRRYALGDGALWRWDRADGTWARVAASGHLQRLVADEAGDVWLTGSQGLWRLGPGDRPVPIARVPYVIAMVGGAKGGWLLTQAGTVAFDGEGLRGVPVPAKYSGSGTITGVLGPDGAPWWRMSLGSVYRGTATGLERVDVDGNARAIARAPDGRVWVVGDRVTTSFGPEGSRREGDGLRADDLAVGPDGRVWAASIFGLFVLDGGKWRTVLAGSLSRVSVDDDGVWWERGRLAPEGALTIGPQDAFNETSAARGTARVGDTWWIAHRFGLFRFDGARVTRPPRPLARLAPLSLAEAPDGALWVGLEEGHVARLDARGWRTWRLPAAGGMYAPDVFQIVVLEDGAVQARVRDARANFVYDAVTDTWRTTEERTPPRRWLRDAAGARWDVVGSTLERNGVAVPGAGPVHELVAAPGGGVWAWGSGLWRVGEAGVIEDASVHVPGESVRDVLIDAHGRVWVLGRSGVVTRDPATGGWTRGGRPYTNDRVAVPGLYVERADYSTHGPWWSAVPGLPRGVPVEGVTEREGWVVLALDGSSYRVSAEIWARIADDFLLAEAPAWDRHVSSMWRDEDGRASFWTVAEKGQVLHDAGAAMPAFVRATGIDGVADVLDVGGRVWVLHRSGALVSRDRTIGLLTAGDPPVAGYLQGGDGAAISDRVAAFVRDGVTFGRPDLPVRPLVGVTTGERWWLLLEDGTLLPGDASGPLPREAVPVRDAVAIAIVGDRVCVGGATVACRSEGGAWRPVGGVERVVAMAAEGRVLWVADVDRVCRVGRRVRCQDVAAGVRALAPDGDGGAWVLSGEGLRHADRVLGDVVVAGDFHVLARDGHGGVLLAGARLVGWHPARGNQREESLPGVARAVTVDAAGRVRVRVGDREVRK